MSKLQVNKTAEFRGHKDAIYNICPSNVPVTFLSSGAEGIVAEWDIRSREGNAIAKMDASIYAMKLIPEQEILVLGLSNGKLIFLNLITKKVESVFQSHQHAIFEILIGPKNGLVYSSDEKGMISVWDLDKRKLLHQQQVSDKSIRTMCYTPLENQIVAGSSDGSIYQLGDDLRPISKIEDAHTLSVFRVALSPYNGLLHSVGRDAHIRIWDSDDEYQQQKAIPAHMFAINDLLFHPEKNIFFTGSMDKSIKIWDGANGELLKVMDILRNKVHSHGVNRFSWIGNRLYSCGDDRLIMEWDFEIP